MKLVKVVFSGRERAAVAVENARRSSNGKYQHRVP